MKNGRISNFSSSGIWQLMSKGRGNFSLENTGKPFDTYIQEKLREYKTGRPIGKESSARPLHWGNFMEGWVFENKLGIDYRLISKERYYHPELRWSGMPDTVMDDRIGDIKNPWTVNSFCDTVDSFESIEKFKAIRPEYYWQLISNCILTGKDKAELIVHIPYLDELESIREATELYLGDQNKIAFIQWAADDELPYLVRGKFYDDLTKFEFDVPEEDRELLISRVTMADEILTKQIEKL